MFQRSTAAFVLLAAILQAQNTATTVRRAGTDRAREGSGTVSLRELLQPPPSKARKEFVRAQKALGNGQIPDSIQHLRKALEIFPSYFEAHNNLGVRYMRLGDFERAATEFEAAVNLDPLAVIANTNLALARIALHRYDEAEPLARRALARDSTFLQARYALGLIAVARNQCTDEAVNNLRRAAEKFPGARLGAARLRVCRGEAAQAAAELRAYLEWPGAENRQAIEAWLKQLQH